MYLEAIISFCALITGVSTVKLLTFVPGGVWQFALILVSFIVATALGFLATYWAEIPQHETQRVSSLVDGFARMGTDIWSVFLGILHGMGGVLFASLGWLVGYLIGKYFWPERTVD